MPAFTALSLWDDDDPLIRRTLVTVATLARSGRSSNYCRSDPHGISGPFFLAPFVPDTAVEDPGHRLVRIVGVPSNLMGVGATIFTAGLGWYLDRRLRTPAAPANLIDTRRARVLVNALPCEQLWPSNMSTGTYRPGKPAPHLGYQQKML